MIDWLIDDREKENLSTTSCKIFSFFHWFGHVLCPCFVGYQNAVIVSIVVVNCVFVNFGLGTFIGCHLLSSSAIFSQVWFDHHQIFRRNIRLFWVNMFCVRKKTPCLCSDIDDDDDDPIEQSCRKKAQIEWFEIFCGNFIFPFDKMWFFFVWWTLICLPVDSIVEIKIYWKHEWITELNWIDATRGLNPIGVLSLHCRIIKPKVNGKRKNTPCIYFRFVSFQFLFWFFSVFWNLVDDKNNNNNKMMTTIFTMMMISNNNNIDNGLFVR